MDYWHGGILDFSLFSLSQELLMELLMLCRDPQLIMKWLMCVIIDESDNVLNKVQSEQRKDEELRRLIDYLRDKVLPEDSKQAVQVVNLGKKGYYLVDGILYYESSDVPDRRRIVVPHHLRQQVLNENDSIFAGHFSAKKLKKKCCTFGQG